MQRLIILHSFSRTPQERWYQSVGQSVADNFTVEIPALPNPDSGFASEWLPAVEALHPDTDTVMVGHSLGGTAIMRYLETANRPVKAIYLVAAPLNDLARNDLHQTGFFERDFNWEAIKANAPEVHVLASEDDDTVPWWQAEMITKSLGATLHKFSAKGHFRQDDFPELVELLKQNHPKEGHE